MTFHISLSDEFLNTFVTQLESNDIVGIGLGGSYVRGEATPYSDVDFLCFYSGTVQPPQKRYTYHDNRLVGIASRTVAAVRRDFTQPEVALYAVPMIRELRILLDKDGTIGKLQQDARAFTWEPLQEAANAYASFYMLRNTEEIHKLLGILLNNDALAFSSAMTTFPVHLTRAVAIQRGTLITTDNVIFRQVRESVGLASPWTRAHIRAVSLDAGPTGVPMLQWRGSALLNLYRETVLLLQPFMRPADNKVVEQTLQIIDTFGLAQ